MTPNDDTGILVPVAESVTLRNTVAYAISEAVSAVESDEADTQVHFVDVASFREFDPRGTDEMAAATELLERVTVWTEEDLGDADGRVDVETAVIGQDRYLFSPGEYARALLEYAAAHDIGRIVLDPGYDPGGNVPMLRPLEVELARGDATVEAAPVERVVRRTVVARAGTLRKYLAVLGASFLFYLALGRITAFDLVTGLATAGVVAAILAPVAFTRQPPLGRLARQTARLAVYTPFLLWEITKANVHIAYVVLHPTLPIDPKLVSFRAAVWGDVPVTTLANSITLTPGTLTVDVAERAFVIHTLTKPAREDLFAGGLERAVRFVFFGRAAARIPSPREREGEPEEAPSPGSELGEEEIAGARGGEE